MGSPMYFSIQQYLEHTPVSQDLNMRKHAFENVLSSYPFAAVRSKIDVSIEAASEDYNKAPEVTLAETQEDLVGRGVLKPYLPPLRVV